MLNNLERIRAKLELEQFRSEALDRILAMASVVELRFDAQQGSIIQEWLNDNVDQHAYSFLTTGTNYTGSKMVWTAYFGFKNVSDAVHMKLVFGGK